MPTIKKFDGYLVNPTKAKRVITPAYDGMRPSERREFAGKHPYNYVNVMRTLEEFDGDGPTLEEILAFNLSNLNRLLQDGSFLKTETPAYYLYSLKQGNHEQTGVIAEIPVSDYVSGRLKKHEDTQLVKENMLTRYHEAVGVTSSPICVAYPDRDDLSVAIERAKNNAPYLNLSTWDEVIQTVWRVDDAHISAEMERIFDEIEFTYLTDGHHRCASGARYSEIANSRPSDEKQNVNSNYLLVALFPQSHMRIFSYFRCIRDLNGMSSTDLVSAIRSAGFQIDSISIKDADRLLPERTAEITMIVEQSAYRIRIPCQMIDANNPVASLDVSILQDRILAAVLGIQDARSDSRLSYMPGVEGISGLISRCRGGWPVGFACVDTKIEEVIGVADAGEVMPPKSTWFDPKLRAGIFLRSV